MATITETGTFPGDIQLWQVPMGPDNVPRGNRAQAIGRITWFDSDVTAAKDAGNVVELAISCTMPLETWALRLMNIEWQQQITDAGAVADCNDWSDKALLTVPSTDETLSHDLCKTVSSSASTITNLFVSNSFIPGHVDPSTGSNTLPGQQFSDPFLPLSPMIFRTLNASANASGAMSWISHMWAYIYTIEQYRQGSIWSAGPPGST